MFKKNEIGFNFYNLINVGYCKTEIGENICQV